MILRKMDPKQRQELLRRFALFAEFGQADLAAVVEETRPVHLPGGEYLFHQNDAAAGMYLLVYGRLRVWLQDDDYDRGRLVGEVNPGETIGEMALLTGGARSASAQAIRDSELLEFPEAAFDRLVRRNPGAMLQLSRLIVQRQQSTMRGHTIRPRVKTITVFPASPDVDAFEFTEGLSRALARLGRVEIIRSPSASFEQEKTSLLEHLHALESAREFVVFPCSRGLDSWTRFALTQADRILILCDPRDDAAPGGEWVPALRDTLARREVVIEHPAASRPSGTPAWCRAFDTRDRHHVIRGDRRSMERLARLVTGRGVGLVLGGGGARGLCHVGLFKSLEVHGVSVDHIGGTSMGGILAAQIADGKSADELREWILSLRRDGVLKNDYTLPLYSVVAGRHFASIFDRWAGDLEMEDLWLDCFCVSANITKSRQEVHRSGKVRHICRATSALPGILPPVHLDGNVLVDGGVLNNVPIDVMAALDRGSVIASRVTPRTGVAATLGPDDLPSGWNLLFRRLLPFVKQPEVPGIAEMITRSSLLAATLSQSSMSEMADYRIDFDMARFGLLDWENAEKIIDWSTEIALRTVESWCLDEPELQGKGK